MSELNMLTEEVPVPVTKEPEKTKQIPEITSDSIHEQIISQNEDGYSPCTIVAVLEEIVNVQGNESLEEIDDEHRHEVESAFVEYCKVDVFSLDGNLINVVLTFDSPTDAYLKDLFNMLNRYKRMTAHFGEQIADAGENDLVTVPMFSLQFMPEIFEAHAVAMYSFPIAFFKTLDEDGRQCNLHLLFDAGNVYYSEINLSEEELSDITANVLREMQIKEDMEQS